MKKAIMLAGVAALLASPVLSPALAQAPAGLYGSGNIIFPNDPAAAAAAGAYSSPGVGGGAFAHEPAYEPAPARGADCARRFKSFDAHSGTYLGRDGRRHICR